MKGVNLRLKGVETYKKLPITFDILHSLHVLNLSNSQELVRVLVCMSDSFYGMLQKSSLFPGEKHSEPHVYI